LSSKARVISLESALRSMRALGGAASLLAGDVGLNG